MTVLVDVAPVAVAAATLEHTYCVHSGIVVARFHVLLLSSVQSLSRVRLCDPMNRSTPLLPVHHQLLEPT